MFLVLLPQRLLLLTSNPFVFTLGIWYKKSVGLGKCTGWPFHDLDPRSRLWHGLTQFACLHDKVRTTQSILTKLANHISIVMCINLINFWGILFLTFFCFVMPPPLGAGGIMFSGCPSVRPSVRPSEAWNTLFWPVHRSVGPPDQPLPFYGMSVRPSVRPSVRRGFRAFAGDCMEGLAWNFTCWCILTIFRTD